MSSACQGEFEKGDATAFEITCQLFMARQILVFPLRYFFRIVSFQKLPEYSSRSLIARLIGVLYRVSDLRRKSSQHSMISLSSISNVPEVFQIIRETNSSGILSLSSSVRTFVRTCTYLMTYLVPATNPVVDRCPTVRTLIHRSLLLLLNFT